MEPEAALLGQRREGLLALDASVPPGGRLRLPDVVGLAISGAGEALATDRALGFVSLGPGTISEGPGLSLALDQ